MPSGWSSCDRPANSVRTVWPPAYFDAPVAGNQPVRLPVGCPAVVGVIPHPPAIIRRTVGPRGADGCGLSCSNGSPDRGDGL